jgi:hypothetical protein
MGTKIFTRPNFDKLPLIRGLLRKWNFYKCVQESLKWRHANCDGKELIKNTPSESEKIELHCTWVTEAFTPSNINKLINLLEKIGWDNCEKNIGEEDSLIKWIQEGRSFSGSDSWMNGGVILSRSDTSRFPVSHIRRTKLPENVDYGRLSIRNVTPSLTLVTIQFVFKSEIDDCLNELLKASYKSKLQYRPSIFNATSATYVGVIEQKREAIKKKINEIHAPLYSWFNDNLPGYYFSSGGTMPTVDMITSRVYEQSEQNPSNFRDSYFDLMLNRNMELWQCKEIKNLEFRLSRRNSEGPAAILFGNYNKLTQGLGNSGGEDRGTLTNKIHMDFVFTLSLWVTHNLLINYDQQLSIVRDRMIFVIEEDKKFLESLNYIKRIFLPISVDVQMLNNDLATLVKRQLCLHDYIDFDPPAYLGKISFVELINQQDEIKMEQLVASEYRINQLILSSGNIASAIANLRIQGNMFWVAVLSLIVSIIAIIIALNK